MTEKRELKVDLHSNQRPSSAAASGLYAYADSLRKTREEYDDNISDISEVHRYPIKSSQGTSVSVDPSHLQEISLDSDVEEEHFEPKTGLKKEFRKEPMHRQPMEINSSTSVDEVAENPTEIRNGHEKKGDIQFVNKKQKKKSKQEYRKTETSKDTPETKPGGFFDCFCLQSV